MNKLEEAKQIIEKEYYNFFDVEEFDCFIQFLIDADEKDLADDVAADNHRYRYLMYKC